MKVVACLVAVAMRAVTCLHQQMHESQRVDYYLYSTLTTSALTMEMEMEMEMSWGMVSLLWLMMMVS